MADAVTDWRRVCRAALETKGAFRGPGLAAAFDAVDRAAFVPPRFWIPQRGADGLYPVADRDVDASGWLRQVWDDRRSAVVQLDDDSGRPVIPAVGDFTSSVSAPDVVFEKLAQLDVRAGCRVLELGTASGYNAALLCELAGDGGRVVTVEVDPGLSAWGAANLKAAGCDVTAVCGDGLAGYPDGGPYDRVLSTATLRRVPREWLGQCAPGAVILAPFGTAYAGGGLVRLVVDGDAASGRFTGRAWYMWARSHRPPRALAPPEEYTAASSPVHPAEVLQGSWEQDFVLGLRVPDIDFAHRGEGEERQAQLWDETGTCVTLVRYGRWWEQGAVKAFGPRNLWDEVVAAYAAWRRDGRPGLTRHGLTVDSTGQWPWLDHPGNPLTPARA